MNAPKNRWTVHLVRGDGRSTHTLQVGIGIVFAAVLAAAVLMVAGFGIGRSWAAAQESATVRSLRAEVRTLRADQGRVTELAARLEVVEREYRRLRSVLTGGAPDPDSSVAVPAAVPGGAPDGAAVPSAPAWPVVQPGFVTRTFGSRGEAETDAHTGIDIAVPSGSYVRAIGPGVVEEAGEDEVYGRYVRIAHRDGLSSLYGHNSWLFVQPGDSVERLQVIALSGNTGRSTAPHLHFEVRRNGALIDPVVFVNQGGGAGRAVPGGVEPE